MQDKRKLAIEVDNVQKIYKLYDKPSDRLKEAFGFGKKTKHKLHYALKGVSMKIYQGETVGIRQVYDPENNNGCSESNRRICPCEWKDLRTAGAGCRLQYGIQRYRECLSERYYDGIF